jgi:hypothetical protein
MALTRAPVAESEIFAKQVFGSTNVCGILKRGGPGV